MADISVGDIALAEKLERFSITDPKTGCRLWQRGLNHSGYGQLRWRGRAHLTHRLAWINRHGPIPAGMCVCHKCDVRTCVNPDHLFLGSRADNLADMRGKGRQRYGTTCGERNNNAKLTADVVRAIRADPRSHRAIAAAYGCSHTVISDVKRRRTWKHVS